MILTFKVLIYFLNWMLINVLVRYFSSIPIAIFIVRVCFVLFCFVYTEHNFLVWKTHDSGCNHTTGAIVDVLGSLWMETVPTSIGVLLRSTLVQADEPSDLRGPLNSTTRHRCSQHVLVYTAPRRSSIQL